MRFEDENFRIDGFFNMEEDEDFRDEDFEEFGNNETILGFAQIDVMSAELSQKLLQKAIDFCENSFFWRFRSKDAKLIMIEETYSKFKAFLEEKQEKEILEDEV